MSTADIAAAIKRLKAAHGNHLNFILAVLVLGVGIAYRAINLGFDSEYTLCKVSVYIGLWFGLFAGIMVSGDGHKKLRMIVAGATVCCALSLLASMSVVLMMGHTTAWISSVNILASALGSMWLMTRFDEVLSGLESLQFADRRQQLYMEKATGHFHELRRFIEKINDQGRTPLISEYWAFREWVRNKAG